MITPKQAMVLVQKAMPDRRIEAIYDYDDIHYVIAAPLKDVDSDKNAPWFRVNKSTGIVSVFVPTANYKKFSDMLHNKQIQI